MGLNRRELLRLTAWMGAAQGLQGKDPRDPRNAVTPGTKSEFELRTWKSLAEWEQHRTELRKQILVSAGLSPMPKRGPVNAKRGGRVEHENFITERVWVETLDGLWVAGNLYLPKKVQGRVPGVLIAHGHWKHGRLENSEECSTPQLGANLAMQGYVALAWDMLGYNSTTQLKHDFGRSDEERAWHFGPLGVQLFNSTRMLDFLASLDEVDQDRIGMTGASGGGTQTFLLAAVDNRVKVVVPVNMVSAHFQGGCDCENTPGLRWHTNNVEIASMAAPRPLLLVAATGDWTKNVPKLEFPAVKKVYSLYDREASVAVWQLDAGHNYNKDTREAVYSFLATHLKGRYETPKEVDAGLAPGQLAHGDVLPMPAGAKSAELIFADWKARISAEYKAMDDAQRRERMAVAMGATWPSQTDVQKDGDRVVLVRNDRGDRIPGLLREGSKPVAALVLDESGAAAAMQSDTAKKLLAEGSTVLALDLFQTGAAKDGRDRGGRHFLTFNPSDDACRVQDVVTGLAWLAGRKPQKIVLHATGKAGAWAHLGAKAAAVKVEFVSQSAPRSEEELVKFVDAPGSLYAGGVY